MHVLLINCYNMYALSVRVRDRCQNFGCMYCLYVQLNCCKPKSIERNTTVHQMNSDVFVTFCLVMLSSILSLLLYIWTDSI